MGYGVGRRESGEEKRQSGKERNAEKKWRKIKERENQEGTESDEGRQNQNWAAGTVDNETMLSPDSEPIPHPTLSRMKYLYWGTYLRGKKGQLSLLLWDASQEARPLIRSRNWQSQGVLWEPPLAYVSH